MTSTATPAKDIALSDLPPQQRQLMHVILDEVGQRFHNSPDNIDAIQTAMGVEPGQLRSLMHSLQLKGFLSRETRRGSQRMWIVSSKAAGGGVRCWECGEAPPANTEGLCAPCSRLY